jgi:K(+)-stimulated pyrophosphate-energized sodium pump
MGVEDNMLTSWRNRFGTALAALLAGVLGPASAFAGEADLMMPDLKNLKGDPGPDVLGDMPGTTLLTIGLGICVLGALVRPGHPVAAQEGPVHKSMAEISELIYATCKTYLETQGKFIMVLWVFIAAVIGVYFGVLEHKSVGTVGDHSDLLADWHRRQLRRGLVRHPREHLRQQPLGLRLPGRQALAHLRHPAEGGHEHRHAAHRHRARHDARDPALRARSDLAGSCFLGFAIGESLGASALRIAGGIFTKIADIGSDLMKIVFNIKEDDARNPGVIADCTGDNAGDSVGPSADGFETYGVTGVALITFILLAVPDAAFRFSSSCGSS